VILLTLSGQWSVAEGYARLGMKRTRFQDLRRRMLTAAVLSLEGGVAGRPRRLEERVPREIAELRCEVDQLQLELSRTRAQLDVAECGVSKAVNRRRAQQLKRRI
jgi:hypothetical protein